ncbi:MAG: diphthamide biosynthesis enzyme Dph2 [Candidatus Aenigmarchaeota archaeon ex4484_52]|nr:MAG: diphthamide biosynthesis enzyme Dph2 [Candidatus Aenigmarchaeota archaeon ex4484_52]
MLSECDIQKIKNSITKHKSNRVAISVPEGMKAEVQKIAQLINGFCRDVVIIAEPCFGACDLYDYEASLLGCDLLLHFGHSDLGIKTKIPTEYIECFSNFSALPQIKIDFEKLNNYKKIALCSTIQHIFELEKIKKFLEKKDKLVFIPSSKKLKYKGQVIGCDCGNIEALNPKIDCVLFIGSGFFHSLNILEKTRVPVFIIGPDKKGILNITEKRNLLLKRKIIKQKKFEEAKNIGLLVSFKKGQLNKNIFKIKKELQDNKKNVFILCMNSIENDKITGLKLDMLVNTACPRLEEDNNVFDVPIINI